MISFLITPCRKIWPKKLKPWLTATIAVDIGTDNLDICLCDSDGKPDVDKILQLPTVALKMADGETLLAIGDEARAVIDRVSNDAEEKRRVEVIQPVRNGKIVNRPVATALLKMGLREFWKQYPQITDQTQIRLIVTVPIKLSHVQEREVVNVAQNATTRNDDSSTTSVSVIDQPMAAAIGSGVYNPKKVIGSLICDIGGGTHQVMAVSGVAGNMASRLLEEGGNAYTEVIQEYCRTKHKIDPDFNEAERVKCEIGAAEVVPEKDENNKMTDGNRTTRIYGKHLETHLGDSVELTSEELVPVFASILGRFVRLIKEVGDVAPKGVVADMAKPNSGLYLAGGGSLLRGLPEYLKKETGYNVYDIPNPQRVVVIGAAMALGSPILSFNFVREPIIEDPKRKGLPKAVKRPSFSNLSGQSPTFRCSTLPSEDGESDPVTQYSKGTTSDGKTFEEKALLLGVGVKYLDDLTPAEKRRLAAQKKMPVMETQTA